ncbi:HlyU family transcriptional regulator [Salipiger sp. H15]|uniref:HlyU family transcriptional regulator n=1 Tax=Alloyangia sp. H15 TaxID=3029062 RepID=A0AAU8AGD6_9RHOB
MSFWSRLFGGGSSGPAKAEPQVEAVEYNGFRIYPAPQPAEGQYRVAARIEAEVDGETKVHQLIRADLIRDHGEAVEASLRKARQMIDEQGTRLFG